jgi:acetyltransferase-like isoleucine patch superfamily enzyme
MFKKIINKILRKLGLINPPAFPSNVKVSKNASIGGDVYMFKTAPITIGEHTMIASKVIIHTSTHDYNDHPMWLKRIDRPVHIGKHVWIGTGSIILPGVKISDYAVVGAGSVVTANVPEGAIVVGNPARIIKWRNVEKIKTNNNPVPEYGVGNIVVKESFIEKNCKEI